MISRGIIKIVSKTGCVHKSRKYMNTGEMLRTIEAFSYLDEVVKGSRFIHVLPNTEELSPEEELEIYYANNLSEPETILNNKYLFMKVTEQEKSFIQENIDSMTAAEMSHHIPYTQSAIQKQ